MIFKRRTTRLDPKLEWLAALPPFSDLAPSDLEIVATMARRSTKRSGTVLTSEGSWPDVVHVIVSGSVRILRDEAEVRRAGPGEWLGEVAIVAGTKRTADAVCGSTTELATFTRKDFEYLQGRFPSVRQSIEASTAERIDRLPPRET